MKLPLIDYDEVFNWKVWQYMKWVTGVIILVLILLGVYYECMGGTWWGLF